MKKITLRSLFLAIAVCFTAFMSAQETLSFAWNVIEPLTPADQEWTGSYLPHKVTFTNAIVYFEKANHQPAGNNIIDIPVTKGNMVSVKIKDGKSVTAAKLVCREWGTKTQTISLKVGTETYTSSNFTLEATALPAGTDTLTFTFSSQKNQVGIESLTLTYADGSTTGVAAPTLPAETQFEGTMNITMTADGADAIKYKLNDDPTELTYSAPIEISKTTKVTAWAVKGSEKSQQVVRTYTLKQVLKAANLAEFRELAMANKTEEITITGTVVLTWINGGQMFFQDASDAIIAYNSNIAKNQAVGNSYTGLKAKYSDNNGNGILQLGIVEPLPKAVAGVAEPDVKVIADIVEGIENRYVVIKNVSVVTGVTFNKDRNIQTTVKDDANNEIIIKDHFKQLNSTLKAGDKINVTGIVSVFDTNMALKITAIEKAPTTPTAVENAELTSNVYSNNGTLFVEAEAGDEINVYTVDGRNIYSAVAASSLNEINVNANMVIVRVNNEVHKVIMK